jgi:glycosyltransferase involved in cell wall biosynthesis
LNNLVSIIIPVFNRQDLISETLDSIISQSYLNWECIIIDDQSTDKTFDVILPYSLIDTRIKLLKRPLFLDKGANICRNYGFKISKGKYIQWFDSDDIMLPTMLENKILKITSDNSDIVINRLGFFKGDANKYFTDNRTSIESKINNLPFDYFAGNFWFGTPQPLFLKSFLYSQKNLFNINLVRNQETELFVRLLLQNPKISYLNDVLVLQRIHDNSIGGNYGSLTDSKKYLIDFPAYKLLFISFIDTPFLTDEVSLYFKNYFDSCLKKMEFKFIPFFNLLIFCLKHKLCKSNVLAIKIFFSRILFILINLRYSI